MFVSKVKLLQLRETSVISSYITSLSIEYLYKFRFFGLRAKRDSFIVIFSVGPCFIRSIFHSFLSLGLPSISFVAPPVCAGGPRFLKEFCHRVKECPQKMVSCWNFLDELKRVQDLEAMYKDSKYPSHGVIEEFAKLNKFDGATVKVWFNNKR